MCTQGRLRSPLASAQSDQSLCCPHEESLGQLPNESTAKTDQTGQSDLGLYCLHMPFCQTIDVLGPDVQSVVSLTSSLRVISLTVLADSIYNILIFFAEKMGVAFAMQTLLTFFQQKISAYLRITQCKF